MGCTVSDAMAGGLCPPVDFKSLLATAGHWKGIMLILRKAVSTLDMRYVVKMQMFSILFYFSD